MPTNLPVHAPSPSAASAMTLNGRKVLMIFCAFFGVIFAMNGLFLYFAFSTFGGIDAAGAYRSNFLLTSQIAAAERQKNLGWTVDGSVTRNAAGTARIEVRAQDRDGKPVSIATLAVELQRPADRRRDRTASMRHAGHGRFEGVADKIDAGQWVMIITMQDQRGERFVSRNRLILK